MLVPKLNEKYVEQIFKNTADAVFKWIDSQNYFTNRTYNLRDSVGVGIYKGDTLVKWVGNPSTKAAGPRLITYHRQQEYVNGRIRLNRAIIAKQATVGRMNDYTLVVFAAAPYGAWVEMSLGDGGRNKQGKGWWSEGLVPAVKNAFVIEFNKVFNKAR